MLIYLYNYIFYIYFFLNFLEVLFRSFILIRYSFYDGGLDIGFLVIVLLL